MIMNEIFVEEMEGKEKKLEDFENSDFPTK